jgi:hypothetical protein
MRATGDTEESCTMGGPVKNCEADMASGACFKARDGGGRWRPHFFDGKTWIAAGSEAEARAEHAARVRSGLRLACPPGAGPR